MRFSVLIPVFNRERYVRQAIDSALSQDFLDFEVVVVDDGSKDGTPDVIRSFGDKIRVIRQENKGAEAARSLGSSEARGEYLVFLDSDDLLMPGALAAYERVIKKCGSPVLILGSMIYFNDARQPQGSFAGRKVRIELLWYKDFLAKDRGLGMSFSKIVVRKSLFEQVEARRNKGLLAFPMDDHDFLLRSGTAGPCVIVIQPPTVAYRVHATNYVNNLEAMIEATLSLLRAERQGRFLGGRERRFSRYAYLGGKVWFWLWKALKSRRLEPAFRLLWSGGIMIVFALIKTTWWRLRGTSSPQILAD